MDGPYYDIEIPRRPKQREVPDDLSLHFALVRERGALRLDIFSDGELLPYTGLGRITLGEGFCHLSCLSMLDPFLQERRFLPAKNFKIFLRVLYPKIAACGYAVSCDVRLETAPAVELEVDASDETRPVCAVHWNADRRALSFLPGFEEFALSHDVFYPGPRMALAAVSHLEDGEHVLDANTLKLLRSHYNDAPYLFKSVSGRFTPAAPQFALPREKDVHIDKDIRIERSFSAPQVVQQTLGDFLDFRPDRTPRAPVRTESSVPAPAPKKIEMDGPALLSFSHSAHVRTENGKFTFFILEAKRFSEYVPEKAEFVPFTCYWPIYTKMSREQRAWYFYWRQSFREGRILKTDLSYIFVLIYELINRAYGTARENLDTLFALWKAYRKDFARLDYYMPLYCADFMILNGMTGRLGEIADAFPLQPGFMRPFAELYLNDKLKNGLHTLDFDLLCQFLDYNIRASRFYAINRDMCRETVTQVLEKIDLALASAKGESLLSSFRPEPVTAIWTAYSGAVCGRAAARQIEAEYLPYLSCPALRDFLTAVCKHTENTLRKKYRYAGRLRGYTLSRDVQALIEKTVGASVPLAPSDSQGAPAEPPKPIEIDLEKARTLESASWENTKKLIDAVDQAQEAMAGDVLFETPREAEPEPEKTQEAPVDVSAFADVYAAFCAQLSDFQRAFLSAILNGEDYAALSARAAQEFTFPEAVYEELNDLAQDVIGDIILSPDGGEIYEEHSGALKNAL